jgi:hypothetical protein
VADILEEENVLLLLLPLGVLIDGDLILSIVEVLTLFGLLL